MLSALITGGLDLIGGTATASCIREDVGDPPERLRSAPTGSGPVVVIGGMATTAPLLAPMAGTLSRLGYDVESFVVGAGLDCSQRTVDALARRVRTIADRSGRAVQLVAHSRGGQFGRAVATRTPEQVAGLTTLGTPFLPYRMTGSMAATVLALAAAGSVGVPGCVGFGCLVGECCRQFRAGLQRPWPGEVPFTSVYSRSDRVVPHGASLDRAARHVEVEASHLGLLTGAEARRAVADTLAVNQAASAA